MELSVIKEKLVETDSRLDRVLLILEGDMSAGINGVISGYAEIREQLNQLMRDFAHLERWRQKQIEDRGKITITISTLVQRIAAIAGAVSTVLYIIEQLKK